MACGELHSRSTSLWGSRTFVKGEIRGGLRGAAFVQRYASAALFKR